MLRILTLQKFVMVPIFKKGQKNKPGKYRLLSLSSPWENHELAPPGTHFGHSGDYQQSAWISQG